MPVARARLVELGAVQVHPAAADAVIDDPGIALTDIGDGSSVPPVQQLVIEIGPPSALDGGHGNGVADIVVTGWQSSDELMVKIDELWRDRVLPFEDNLRSGRRAPRRRVPVLAGPDGWWADDAARLISRLGAAVGDLAMRIDHIGSTSVPGLRAKDLVDIQVTVRNLDDARSGAVAARKAGLVHVEGSWFGEDRSGLEHLEEVAVDADPGRSTNVNFRPVTAPVWRDALLFRDWLRAHADERASYEAMKEQLISKADVHVDCYSEDKMPWIRSGLNRAESWASSTGWTP